MPHALANTGRVSDVANNEIDKKAADLLKIIVEQERLAKFAAFSADDAWAIGTTIRDTFKESYADNGAAGIVIHIETFTGHRLFSSAIGNPDAIGAENWNWVQAKTNVVKRFGVSSLRKGREIASKGQTPEEKGLHFPEYACHGGGFPINLKNNTTGPIGVIVVSGLPQLKDHQLIIDSLAKLDSLLA